MSRKNSTQPDEQTNPKRNGARQRNQGRGQSTRDRLLKWAHTVPIELQPVAQGDIDILRELALEHRNNRYSRGKEHLRTTMQATDTQTLDRWCVNFLRHRHTLYDRRTNRVGRGTTQKAQQEALSIIRKRVNLLIIHEWPQLAQECQRQLDQNPHRP